MKLLERGVPRMNGLFTNLFLHRVAYKTACAVLLPLCALVGVGTLAGAPDPRGSSHTPAEWPQQWQGQALRPLALSEVEQRFARQFPGDMARLTDGQQVLVLRRVRQPTRMLHPAADCYQGLGYKVSAIQLEHDAHQRLWRCFEAARGGQRQRVCERIEDAQGQGWTDTSAWYWAATLGQSHGPWQAVTVARAL